MCFTALSRSDPSLAAVATPRRDVGCVVAIEKQLQFFIVPLKWVISRKWGEKEKKGEKKLELFREQQRSKSIVLGKKTENTEKIKNRQ